MSATEKLQAKLNRNSLDGYVMAQTRARSAVKVEARRTDGDLVSGLFIICALLALTSVIPMWSHWAELSASLGFYSAACLLTAITAAALFVSYWLNTDNG